MSVAVDTSVPPAGPRARVIPPDRNCPLSNGASVGSNVESVMPSGSNRWQAHDPLPRHLSDECDDVPGEREAAVAVREGGPRIEQRPAPRSSSM